MNLSAAGASIGVMHQGLDAEFDEVGTDSRSGIPGMLFVALKGDRFDGHDFVREVLAKGAGELAGLMRGIARNHKIPVVENKKLARALFTQVDFDGPVPEPLYPDVARLLVWIYAMREQNRREATA